LALSLRREVRDPKRRCQSNHGWRGRPPKRAAEPRQPVAPTRCTLWPAVNTEQLDEV